MKILVVEDNPELSKTIESFLTSEGYVCETSASAAEALLKLSGFDYDCVLLDLMLPDQSGFELLEWIKKEDKDVAVMIISARNVLEDKIKGLENGADDYLTKPFHLTELNARIKAIHRRKKLDGNHVIKWRAISVDTNTMEVQIHSTVMDLTKKEYDLLVYFLINRNRILTRQSIAEHLWGDYAEHLGNFDFVYQHVKNLRKKMMAAAGEDYIETVYGLGYKLATS